MVGTCTGAAEQITGMADIFMHFKGENGTKLTFELNIVIHPSIKQEFYWVQVQITKWQKQIHTSTFRNITLICFTQSIRKPTPM